MTDMFFVNVDTVTVWHTVTGKVPEYLQYVWEYRSTVADEYVSTKYKENEYMSTYLGTWIHVS